METAQTTSSSLETGTMPLTCPTIVRREEMPSLTQVTKHGVTHDIGLVKDFRKHPAVAGFLPESARPALSWVHLDVGCHMDSHRHGVDSLLIVCQGSALLRGDIHDEVFEGDIVLIPRGTTHGFTGSGANGFWGISMQFEARGLYEDPANPLVHFVEMNGVPISPIVKGK